MIVKSGELLAPGSSPPDLRRYDPGSGLCAGQRGT